MELGILNGRLVFIYDQAETCLPHKRDFKTCQHCLYFRGASGYGIVCTQKIGAKLNQ